MKAGRTGRAEAESAKSLERRAILAITGLIVQARERPACPKLLDFPYYDQKIRALGMGKAGQGEPAAASSEAGT
jgi:hypothetical protein